jgi:cysteine desulfuration protein SufE
MDELNIKETQNKIVEDFEALQEWDERYGQIIKMGKELSPLPEEFKTDKFKLNGCQSQVWINAKLENGKIFFSADSDAMIVKGLIAMLIKVYSGRTPEEILSTPPDFLKKLGIDNHLSPTRKNGLSAMLKQIQMYAFAFKTITDKGKK